MMMTTRSLALPLIALVCSAHAASSVGQPQLASSVNEQTALEHEAASFIAMIKKKHGGGGGSEISKALEATLKDTSVLRKLKKAGCFGAKAPVSCPEAMSTIGEVGIVEQEVNEQHSIADEAVATSKKVSAAVDESVGAAQQEAAAESKVEATHKEVEAVEHEAEEEKAEEKEATVEAADEVQEAAAPEAQADPVIKEAETFKSEVAQSEAQEQTVEAQVKVEEKEETVRKNVVQSMEEVTAGAEAKAAEADLDSEEEKVEALEEVISPAAVQPMEQKIEELEKEIPVLPPAVVADEKEEIVEVKQEIAEVKEEAEAAEVEVEKAEDKKKEVAEKAADTKAADTLVDEFGTLGALKDALDACPEEAAPAATPTVGGPDSVAPPLPEATVAAPASFLQKKASKTTPKGRVMIPCPVRKHHKKATTETTHKDHRLLSDEEKLKELAEKAASADGYLNKAKPSTTSKTA